MTLPKRILNTEHMALLNRLRYSMAIVLFAAILITTLTIMQ